MVDLFGKELYFKAENERLLTLYRTYLVVETLQKNSKEVLVLDIAKASFFDFVISDHNLTRRVLTYFKPEIKLDDRFYVKDIYENLAWPGNVFEDSGIRKNIALLCGKGLLEIKVDGGNIFIKTSAPLLAPQNGLVIFWRDSLIKLKPLVGKSLNQLYKGLLENHGA